MMSVYKTFKRKYPPEFAGKLKANNGKPKYWEVTEYVFRRDCELVDNYERTSLYEIIEQGWIPCDPWEFGAINNGLTVPEWKKLHNKLWEQEKRGE